MLSGYYSLLHTYILHHILSLFVTYTPIIYHMIWLIEALSAHTKQALKENMNENSGSEILLQNILYALNYPSPSMYVAS